MQATSPTQNLDSSELSLSRAGPLSNSHTPNQPWYFLQPKPSPERVPDVTDSFASYLHAEQCGVSSLDLHLPIHPLCDSRTAVLEAMSNGGRAGFDKPFIPSDCDFRWYTTAEICSILGRFSHVFFIGDSLQRMLTTAIYALIRQDIGLGGVAEWEFEHHPQFPDATTNFEECACEDQFRRHECSTSYIRQYSDLVGNTSAHNAPACSAGSGGDLPFEMSFIRWQGYPPGDDEKQDLLSVLPNPPSKPDKPYAFVMHHTFWNEVNVTSTVSWVDELTSFLRSTLPFLPAAEKDSTNAGRSSGFPRLFVTANAPGILENQLNFPNRTNQAIAMFERGIRPHLESREIELLGFYNMSVQTTSNDNIHASMRTNLLKAMMVMNWLDWVGREEAETWNQPLQ